MATTITISATIQDDAKALEITNAFCEANGYDPASGVSKAQFVRDKTKEEMKAFIITPWLEQQRKADEAASRANRKTQSEAIS